jgi:lipid-binding SYLF domain-containing protein
MRKTALVLSICSSAFLVLAADTPQERLTDATQIFTEIMATPDKGIPQDLLEKAHCVVIVPGLKQAAFGIGGKFGRGYATCRRNAGGWGAPASIRVEGGSFGFQIGASSTDVIMLVMDDHGMRRLMQDKVTLGAEATVAAGPVGRSTAANTDAQLSAEILSWSRSKGLFAGIALQGATLRPDQDVNKELYGSKLTSKDILMTDRKVPEEARPLISALNKYSRFEDKDKPIESRAKDSVTGDADRAKTKKQ